MIGLVDYGAGNLFSVRNALGRLGLDSRLIASPAEFEDVDRIILPGVGHFGAAAGRLRASGVFDDLRNWAARGRPLLGICLGMQLLFDESEEDGRQSSGLGIFPGRVVRLLGPRRIHIGWSAVTPNGKRGVLPEGPYYFVHGFAPQAASARDILAECRFGETSFSAAVGRGAILGVQFHPEKSGLAGLKLLARWAEGRMDLAPAADAEIEAASPAPGPSFSSPAVRVIPCLDMDEGRVVKGVRFQNVRDEGDPAELARRYGAQGADELCFLDVGASWKIRKTLLEIVRRVSQEVFIPLTVGGGLRTVEDIREALNAGADKVSLCTAAVENPELLSDAAGQFGRQCVVLSLDAKAKGGSWTVTTHGGRRDRNLDAVEWATRAEALGAGEILVNAVDRDGTGAGYDLELLRRIRDAVRIPVIASGGGEEPAQAWAAVEHGEADAVLLASALHSGRRTVADYKAYLREKGARVR
jgi:cyclase